MLSTQRWWTFLKQLPDNQGFTRFSLDSSRDQRETRILRTRGSLQSRAGYLTAPAPQSRTQNEGHEAVDRTPTLVHKRREKASCGRWTWQPIALKPTDSGPGTPYSHPLAALTHS
jgi:hypothetical protein